AANTMTLVSHSAAGMAVAGNHRSADPSISADGRFVAFDSEATDLILGSTDGNGRTGRDIFVYDRLSGGLTLVSHASDNFSTGSNGDSFAPDFSADGTTVVFASTSTNIIPGFVFPGGPGTTPRNIF